MVLGGLAPMVRVDRAFWPEEQTAYINMGKARRGWTRARSSVLRQTPFALERAEVTGTRRRVYHLPKPGPDGRTDVTLRPLELIEPLAGLIPPPRLRRHRYHGVPVPSSPPACGGDAADQRNGQRNGQPCFGTPRKREPERVRLCPHPGLRATPTRRDRGQNRPMGEIERVGPETGHGLPPDSPSGTVTGFQGQLRALRLLKKRLRGGNWRRRW